jgi:hypothetical protein
MRLPRMRLTVRRMMVAVPTMFLLVAGCGTDEYQDPRSVFQATFQTTGGPGITILQANGRAWGDNSDCYLRFKASASNLSALMGTGFRTITAREYFDSGTVGPVPAWWNPSADQPTVFYHSGAFHPSYREGQAITAYNPQTQIVNFYWDGND